MSEEREEREERVGNCVCGNTFPIPAKRGRPPVRCVDCREAYANGTLPDRLASLGIDHHVALRKTNKFSAPSTPRGPTILGQGADEIENVDEVNRVEDRLNRLEGALKSRGLHISQHRDKW